MPLRSVLFAMIGASMVLCGCSHDGSSRTGPVSESPEGVVGPKKQEKAVDVVGERDGVAVPGSTGGELVNSVGMRFRKVMPGEFVMDVPIAMPGVSPEAFRKAYLEYGSLSSFGSLFFRSPCWQLEKKRVRLTRPYWISVYEVSLIDFERVMGRKPKYFVAGRVGVTSDPAWPALSVSWEEAVEFCGKLSERPEEQARGRRYRLPTEFEWVKADCSTRFNWGTVPGEWRVHEWCSDWFDLEYYRTMPAVDSPGPEKGTEHVARVSHNVIRVHFNPCTLRVVVGIASERS